MPDSCLPSPPAVTGFPFSWLRWRTATLLPQQAKDGCLPSFKCLGLCGSPFLTQVAGWGSEEGASPLHGRGAKPLGTRLPRPFQSLHPPQQECLASSSRWGIRVEPQPLKSGLWPHCFLYVSQYVLFNSCCFQLWASANSAATRKALFDIFLNIVLIMFLLLHGLPYLTNMNGEIPNSWHSRLPAN